MRARTRRGSCSRGRPSAGSGSPVSGGRYQMLSEPAGAWMVRGSVAVESTAGAGK